MKKSKLNIIDVILLLRLGEKIIESWFWARNEHEKIVKKSM